MSYQPLVSCITIFLNGEAFIEETIASIFTQTYEPWELLLVDDGSTDRSTIIAQQYAQKYPDKIRYLEHEGHQNRGMSASRNLGIHHAKGELIAFLDADDIWVPTKLAEQVTILDRYPAAVMVYGTTQIWYSWTNNLEDQQRDHFYDLGVSPNTLIDPPQLLLQLLKNKCQTPTTCNALIRRQVFETIGYFEESFRTMYEDQVFFAKVLLHAPVFVADTCWAKYRQHSQSCSSQEEASAYYSKRKPFLHWLERYFTRQGIEEDRIWQALRWEQWQAGHPGLAHWINRLPFSLQNLISQTVTVTQRPPKHE